MKFLFTVPLYYILIFVRFYALLCAWTLSLLLQTMSFKSVFGFNLLLHNPKDIMLLFCHQSSGSDSEKENTEIWMIMCILARFFCI